MTSTAHSATTRFHGYLGFGCAFSAAFVASGETSSGASSGAPSFALFAYVAASAAFALRESRGRARAVVIVSLIYVPALYSLTLMDPLVRAIGARGSL